jgi:hypothetical protein
MRDTGIARAFMPSENGGYLSEEVKENDDRFNNEELQKLQNYSPQNFRDLLTCLSCP